MRKLLFAGLFLLSTVCMADVSPSDVDDMLKQMVADNVISVEEAARARARLKGMDPEQWSKLKAAGAAAASRMPASEGASTANAIQEVNGLDLDGAQFKQIQNDLRKIVPQANN